MTNFGVNRSNYSISTATEIANRWRNRAGINDNNQQLTQADLQKVQDVARRHGTNSKALNDITASFQSLDKDGNGKLSNEEIQTGLNLNVSDQGRKPLPTNQQNLGAYFENQAYDKYHIVEGGDTRRGDHLISRTEFDAGRSTQQKTIADKQFDQFDRNHDGVLGGGELNRLNSSLNGTLNTNA